MECAGNDGFVSFAGKTDRLRFAGGLLIDSQPIKYDNCRRTIIA
jgi:hypothetical protein